MMTVEEEIDFNKQMIAGEIARQKRSFFQRAGAVSAFESGPMACVAMNLVTKCGGRWRSSCAKVAARAKRSSS